MIGHWSVSVVDFVNADTGMVSGSQKVSDLRGGQGGAIAALQLLPNVAQKIVVPFCPSRPGELLFGGVDESNAR